LTYVIFCGWIFYGLSAATVFVYRKRLPDADRPYKVPGYPWTPLLFIIAASVLVVNTLLNNLRNQPGKTAFALGSIALGLPAYFIWRSRSLPSPGASLAPEEN
jgi:APA family basic amino acid/polyamine antiporter